MIAPHLLLRDALALVVLTTSVALALGGEAGMGFAAGAFASLANLALWVFAVKGLVNGTFAQGLLPFKTILAIGLVWFLAEFFPGAATFVGFAVPFVAIVGRGLFGLPETLRAR